MHHEKMTPDKCEGFRLDVFRQLISIALRANYWIDG